MGGKIFHTCPDRPWGPPSLLYNGYRVFPGGKERPGRDADPSPPSSAVVSCDKECYYIRGTRGRVFTISLQCRSRPGSSVGIATGYWLDGPGIECRWTARFSTPVQTGPGAHPASCTMGTGSFPQVKSGRGVTLTPHPLLVP